MPALLLLPLLNLARLRSAPPSLPPALLLLLLLLLSQLRLRSGPLQFEYNEA